MKFHGRRLPPDWLLLLLLAGGVFLWQRTALPPWMVDLFHIQYAAYEWSIGEPQWMYTPLAHHEQWIEHRAPVAERLGAEGDPNPHLYPPFLAAVLSPLSHYPASSWRDVLFAINVALIFVFAWLIARLVAPPTGGGERPWRVYAWALALVLLAYPMARAAKLGQIVPLQAAILWWGILEMRKRRDVAAGVLIGLIAALKMFPIGLAFIPLIGRRFRLAAVLVSSAALVYGISILRLGIEVHRYWWEAVSEFGSLIWPFFGNQSFPGWMSRLVLGHALLEETPISGYGVTILKLISLLVFGGATGWVLWRHRRECVERQLVPAMGLLLSGMILALPNSWEHYWMYVLPALAWALYQVRAEGETGMNMLLLLTASFFFLMKLTRFYGDSALGHFISGSQTIGMLLFWLWLIGYLNRHRPSAQAA